MALTENPKLAMIPSGYGDYKVYSVLPSDGTGDFDFVRSSAATRVNKDGLIETVGFDVPRLNYPLIDGVVSGCPSLFLEPQSLNQIINSENLSNASWDKTNAVVESNSTISPDGTLTADKLTFNTSGNFGRIVSPNLTFVNSVSFFVKYIDLEYILIFLGTSSNGVYVNLKERYVTSTVLGAGLDITFKKFPNDWLRIEASGGNNGTSLEIYAANSTPTYNPINVNGSFYLWGLQAETNSYPTSYIKTTSAAVTRSAETCNNAGDANTFNDSEGVLMAEISALDDDLTVRRINITDGSFDNAIRLGFTSTSNQIIGVVASSGTQAVLTYTVNDINSFNRLIIKYKQNDFSLWVNGFEVDTDLIGTTPIGLNDISFDFVGTGNFYGNTKQLQYFDTALTDTDLEELTSWTSFNEMAESQLYSVY